VRTHPLVGRKCFLQPAYLAPSSSQAPNPCERMPGLGRRSHRELSACSVPSGRVGSRREHEGVGRNGRRMPGPHRDSVS
jgi:hypothetical protein